MPQTGWENLEQTRTPFQIPFACDCPGVAPQTCMLHPICSAVHDPSGLHLQHRPDLSQDNVHLALGRPCTQGAPLRDRLARIWAGVEACLALSAATLALSLAGEAPWACSTTPSRPRMVRVLPVPGGPCTWHDGLRCWRRDCGPGRPLAVLQQVWLLM